MRGGGGERDDVSPINIASSHRLAVLEQHLGDESFGDDVEVRAPILPHDNVAQHGAGRAIANTVLHGEVVVSRPFPPSRLVEVFRQGDAGLNTTVQKKWSHLFFVCLFFHLFRNAICSMCVVLCCVLVSLQSV